MNVAALPDFLTPSLELTVHGRSYVVPPVSIEAGARIMVLLETGEGGDEIGTLALGAAARTMRRDNVAAAFYARAEETALADMLTGRDHAEEVWLHGAAEAAARPSQELKGLEALDEYGRGEKDPVTGMYEWYEDLPREAAAVSEATSTSVTWRALFEAWDVVEHAFHAHLGVDLEQVWQTQTWRWFRIRLRGLLGSDTSLAAHFRPTDSSAAAGEKGPAAAESEEDRWIREHG